MPRYYFDIVGKAEAFTDTEGIKLPNDAVAHEYAINLIGKTMLYDSEDCDWRGCRIDVLDERQALIVNVLYPIVISSPDAEPSATEYGTRLIVERIVCRWLGHAFHGHPGASSCRH
jgi:hypothetical protein